MPLQKKESVRQGNHPRDRDRVTDTDTDRNRPGSPPYSRRKKPFLRDEVTSAGSHSIHVKQADHHRQTGQVLGQCTVSGHLARRQEETPCPHSATPPGPVVRHAEHAGLVVNGVQNVVSLDPETSPR
ncbi:hypothetical protein BaRGS_00020087 [Batillaria attramentaria]|uniref:Uncharacterized protein n=1 Tax=Batillaria attramentaria TaxID=370345 RepID=A0ABD0KNL1_9CAEN